MATSDRTIDEILVDLFAATEDAAAYGTGGSGQGYDVKLYGIPQLTELLESLGLITPESGYTLQEVYEAVEGFHYNEMSNFATFQTAILSGIQDLIIANSPVIDGGATAAFNVDENTTTVTTVTATDNQMDVPTYSIIGGADAALFQIDAGGELSFINVPDYETPLDVAGGSSSPGDNIYDVIIQAEDLDGGTDTQAVSVTVTDVNDAPVITPFVASISFIEDFDSYTGPFRFISTQYQTGLSVYAGEAPDSNEAIFPGWSGAGIHPSHAVDLDPGLETNFALQLYSGNLGGTSAQPNTLTLNSGIAANDAGVVYDVSFEAAPTVWNAGTQSTTSEDGILVEILRTDNSVLESFTYQPGAWEGSQDSFNLANFEYIGDGSGDIRIQFSSNPSLTGHFGGAIDNLTILSQTEVETTNLSITENATAVAVVDSSDPDNGDSATYSILDAIDGGAVDSEFFTINPSTGELEFSAAPDFETPLDEDGDNIYEVAVKVTDSGGLMDTQDLTVTVTDINEAPTITSSNAASVVENTTAVLTVTATDPDGDTPTYSISGGADRALFNMDTTTGALSFITAPNFEAPSDSNGDNVYEFDVTADDGNGATNTQTISVTVTDVDEATETTIVDLNQTLSNTGQTDFDASNGTYIFVYDFAKTDGAYENYNLTGFDASDDILMFTNLEITDPTLSPFATESSDQFGAYYDAYDYGTGNSESHQVNANGAQNLAGVYTASAQTNGPSGFESEVDTISISYTGLDQLTGLTVEPDAEQTQPGWPTTPDDPTPVADPSGGYLALVYEDDPFAPTIVDLNQTLSNTGQTGFDASNGTYIFVYDFAKTDGAYENYNLTGFDASDDILMFTNLEITDPTLSPFATESSDQFGAYYDAYDYGTGNSESHQVNANGAQNLAGVYTASAQTNGPSGFESEVDTISISYTGLDQLTGLTVEPDAEQTQPGWPTTPDDPTPVADPSGGYLALVYEDDPFAPTIVDLNQSITDPGSGTITFDASNGTYIFVYDFAKADGADEEYNLTGFDASDDILMFTNLEFTDPTLTTFEEASDAYVASYQAIDQATGNTVSHQVFEYTNVDSYNVHTQTQGQYGSEWATDKIDITYIDPGGPSGEGHLTGLTVEPDAEQTQPGWPTTPDDPTPVADPSGGYLALVYEGNPFAVDFIA